MTLPPTGWLRRHARRLVALGLMLATYALSRLPEPTAEERLAQTRSFRFEGHPIATPPAASMRSIRAVHPSLRRIAAWISAVGAAVALTDLNDDGLSDDVCLVDPRTDQVIVSRVGTLAAEPFALHLQPWVDTKTMAPMGCLPGDYNEDGRIDLLVYFWGRTPVMFMRRSGATGDAAYVAKPLVEPDEAWYTNAVTRADLDGDGHADIVVANYFPDGSHILDASGHGVESMQASMSRARNGGQKHVFLWTPAADGSAGGPSFRRSSNAFPAEVSGTWTLALAAGDLDGDLLPEIYFANDFGPDVLLHNESTPGGLRFRPLYGRRSLTMPRSKVVGGDSFKGMGVDFADVNRDGLPDILVGNIASTYALEESHFLFLSTGRTGQMKDGVAPYADASERLGLSRSGWAWDTKLDDFNNDGVLEAVQATGFVQGTVSKWPELQELATGNDQLLHDPRSWHRFEAGTDLSGHDHNPFFVRHQDGRYYDVAADVGLGGESVSRGIAIADVDRDGLLDFAVANQWAPSTFFANRAPATGAFLGLRLLRPLDARQPFTVLRGRPGRLTPGLLAVGAAARVWLPGGELLAREVDAGNGHSGKRSPELHFGLGAIPAGAAVDVALRWRDYAGQPQARRLRLTPGWHTVLLGR